MDGGRTTLGDVALAARVSKTTVSHVLSGKRPVSAETRARVEQVIESLGFRPNYFAQALNTARTATVALLVDDLANPHYPALARGLQSVVAPAGNIVVLFDAAAGAALTSRFLATIRERRVDAIVLAGDVPEDELIRLQAEGVAAVLIAHAAADVRMDRVTVDDEAIGFDAAARMIAAGHRRVVFVGSDAGKAPGGLRLEGYRRAMLEAGHAPTDVALGGKWTRADAAHATRELLRAAPARPTALVCANDLIAVGALDAARALRLAVPADVAIIGVDDIEAAAMVTPALTSIRIPSEQLGRRAGELLLRRLEDPGAPQVTDVLAHELVERDSI
ncbi:LacI family DNA-binding transcriptional regulator [Microbacterium sp. DT81.1]|uniref:LacI family DNA-binding transcriptional regulator n=1 Tax=Microbacterium sp. DT81.1 TaxID=3393413 RepID=UPI003CEB4AEC